MVRALTVAVSKLVMVNVREVAELQGAAGATFIGRSDVPALAAATKAGAEYYEDVQKAGKDHGYGPPHARVCAALLRPLVDDTAAPRGARAVLRRFWDSTVANGTPDQVVAQVPVCKVRKAFKKKEGDPDMTKVILVLHPRLRTESVPTNITEGPTEMTFEQALEAALAAVGAQIKRGTAPKGHLEREVDRLSRAAGGVR